MRRIDRNDRGGMGFSSTSLHSSSMINHPGVAVRNVTGTQDGLHPSMGLRYTSSPTLPNQQVRSQDFRSAQASYYAMPFNPFQGTGNPFSGQTFANSMWQGFVIPFLVV